MCVIGIIAVVIIYWLKIPGTPRELFETRCSTCHDLPSLSGYQRHELAPLVNFMRSHNGASRVISEQEAQLIIRYLEDNRPLPPTNNTTGQ